MSQVNGFAPLCAHCNAASCTHGKYCKRCHDKIEKPILANKMNSYFKEHGMDIRLVMEEAV